MKPAAHGTKHCQRYRPFVGVRNVKTVVVWSLLSVHGALAHGFFAVLETPWSGIERLIAGIANTCEAVAGSIACVGLPSSVMPPVVPVGSAMNGLRSPAAEA